MRRHVRASLVAVTLAGLLSIVPPGASAQDSTPSIPGAEDRTVEPRTEEEVLVIAASATPMTSESYDEAREARRLEWEGVTVVGPADFETQQAIRNSVLQVVACVNADMPLSQYALFTEDAIRNNSVSVEELRGELREGEVTEDDGPGRVLDVLNIQMLSNGQAVAVVVFAGESALPLDAYAMYFEEVDGRWLLDTP